MGSMMTWNRRRAIKAVIAGGAAALCPWQGLFAQSGGTLLRTPKQALVIGNGKYKQVPLKNPLNDARGMADALKSAGFGVTLGLELTQAGIQEAIRVYTDPGPPDRLVQAPDADSFPEQPSDGDSQEGQHAQGHEEHRPPHRGGRALDDPADDFGDRVEIVAAPDEGRASDDGIVVLVWGH